MKHLLVAMVVATCVAAMPTPGFAQAKIYHDRAPAAENDRIMGQLFLDSLFPWK